MDIAKAIGILVVLVVHTGLSLGPVTFFGGMFYMPVFFVLAGMTFSWKPEERFGTFIGKKAKRLLLPYFGYNLFLFLFFFIKDSLLPGQVTGNSFFPLLGILYSRNCLLPPDCVSNVYFMQILNAPTWFLTGMFVSCMIFWLMMRAAKGDMKKLFGINCIVLLIAVLLHYFCRILFLTGMFVSCMIFWLMMRAAKGDMKKLFGINCIVLLIAVLLHYFCRILLPWSIDCALYAVSFMLLGKVVSNTDLVKKISSKPLLFLGLTAAFLLLLCRFLYASRKGSIKHRSGKEDFLEAAFVSGADCRISSFIGAERKRKYVCG